MEQLFFFFFFFLLSLIAFFVFRHSLSRKPSSAGLKSYPLLGHLPQFLANRHRFLDWITDVIASSPTLTMGVHTPGQIYGIITANPANVEHILKNNFENYPKGKRSIGLLHDFLGRGIFNSDGEDWKQQRKTASFEFNKRSLRNFVVKTVKFEIENRLLPLMRKAGERNDVVDLQDLLERFAFDNICKVAFNEDPGSLSEETTPEFMKAFGDAQNLITKRFMDAMSFSWKIKKLLNVGSEKKLKESISVAHNFAMEIIRFRKENPSLEGDDLLSRFAEDKENSEELLRDIVISFLLAGRETTSSALTWFFWLISTKHEVEEKILEEVNSVRAQYHNSSETYSFDELREMHYLHAAITESLRLYPPVPLDTQSCKADDVMPDGTFVGKNWFVTYSAYAMGRLEEIWGKDCLEYKPERWLEDGVFKPENPFRFTVFHAGPRMCLGKEMAYIQMKSIAACLLEQFEIGVMLPKDRAPEHVLSLTLRMQGGLQIQVRKRVTTV